MTPPTDQQHRMRPTSVASLLVTALATAAVAWLAISRFYEEMPRLPWLPPLTLFGLALVEAVTAASTKARIERREGTVPVNPLVVAWYVVLAKASAVAGAMFGGAYAGLFVWLLAERARLAAAGDDLPRAVAGLIASAALVAGGLWLERACRVPPGPDDESSHGGTDTGRPGPDRSVSG